MTLTETAPSVASIRAEVDFSSGGRRPTPDPGGGFPGRRSSRGVDPRRLVALGVVGVLVLAVASAVVIYGIGPLAHARDQRTLLATERVAINNAVHDNQGLYRAALPTQPPAPGQPLGILAVPALGLEQVVVEGVGPSQTVIGPGHVPGTAGLGQPGNSAVVARRAGYGGPFGQLGQLRPGDHIVTATTEGQALYVVRSVHTVILTTPSGAASTDDIAGSPTSHPSLSTGTTVPSPKSGTPASAAVGSSGPSSIVAVSANTLYGPSAHDQLTLVTSAAAAPWNADRALVVIARERGQPYAPTPQESRSPSQQGNTGDPGALAGLLLALLALGATLVGAVALYRRSTVRSAYLLSTALLLAFTVLAAEAAGRLLPAWT